jgi:polysaccharide export outer membrane protein
MAAFCPAGQARTWAALLFLGWCWLAHPVLAAAEPGAGTTPPGPTPMSGSTTNAVSQSDVRLMPGDAVQILVYNNPDLERVVRVSDAPVTFPLIGEVGSFAGMTVSAVEQQLTARLADGYLVHPAVSVLVRDFAPRSIGILGSVRMSLRVEIDPHVTFSALQLIAQAGGLTDDADRSHVMILRGRSGPGAMPEILRLPASGQDATTVADVRIGPGDTIVVPRIDRIFVLGEVGRPGPVQIDGDKAFTITRAIANAGGFLRYARKARVQLLRDGVSSLIDVDAILDGKDTDDRVLRPGDVLFVPETLF